MTSPRTVSRRSFLASAAATAAPAAFTLAPHTARAQEFQRIVIPFASGSGSDVTGRTLADSMGRVTGKPVVVENKPGAGSVVGSQDIARARPDGNALLYTTGAHTTNAVLMRALPFDPIADFTPITRVFTSGGFALLVGEKSPFKTIEQFVAAARANPGRYTYGSAGIGNTTHVIGALFCKGAGVDLLHIPFKGTPTVETMAGTVDCAFFSPSGAAEHIRTGKLRALGISGRERTTLMPDTPTFAEAGLQVADIPAWVGLWGPPKMPAATVQAVYQQVSKAAKSPAIVELTTQAGSRIDLLPPDAFKAYVASEIARYRELLPPLGIQIG